MGNVRAPSKRPIQHVVVFFPCRRRATSALRNSRRSAVGSNAYSKKPFIGQGMVSLDGLAEQIAPLPPKEKKHPLVQQTKQPSPHDSYPRILSRCRKQISCDACDTQYCMYILALDRNRCQYPPHNNIRICPFFCVCFGRSQGDGSSLGRKVRGQWWQGVDKGSIRRRRAEGRPEKKTR